MCYTVKNDSKEPGMQLKERVLANKKLFWACVAGGALLAAALLSGLMIGLILLFSKPEEPEPPKITKPVVQERPAPRPSPPKETSLTPQDFQYDGEYLTCIAAPSRLGIDISEHQGQIDWQAVKDAGITFAMIRVGGRGYGMKGALYKDDLFRINYEGAKAAGIEVGAYFFSQATSVAEAKEEAALVLEQIKGLDLNFPVVYDWERMEYEDSRTLHTDPRTVTDCMIAFCEEIEAAHQQVMIYFNPDHAADLFYIEEVTSYRFWLAYYTDWMDFPYKVDMWQYTNEGRVPGIEGDVDINLYFPEADRYIKE